MKLNELKIKFDSKLLEWDRVMMDFPWEDPVAYGDWCAQTYHYVCHSTRLLALAAAYFPLDRNDMHYRCVGHIKEESNHEKLSLMDLKNLGSSIQNYPVRPETQLFYQRQYDLILKTSPFCLFGYILMLEGAAAFTGPKCFERVKKAHGPKAGHFWKVHSEEDQDHIAEAFAVLENMSETEIGLVYANAVASGDQYGAILKAIGAASSVRRPKAS